MITREPTIINDLNGIISYQMFGGRLQIVPTREIQLSARMKRLLTDDEI